MSQQGQKRPVRPTQPTRPTTQRALGTMDSRTMAFAGYSFPSKKSTNTTNTTTPPLAERRAAPQVTRKPIHLAIRAANDILTQRAHLTRSVVMATYFAQMVLLKPEIYKYNDAPVHDTAIDFISCMHAVFKAGATNITWYNDQQRVTYVLGGTTYVDLYRTGLWGGDVLGGFEDVFVRLFYGMMTREEAKALLRSVSGEMEVRSCAPPAEMQRMFSFFTGGELRLFPQEFKRHSISDAEEDPVCKLTMPEVERRLEEPRRIAEDEMMKELLAGLTRLEEKELQRKDLRWKRLNGYLDKAQAAIANWVAEREVQSKADLELAHEMQKKFENGEFELDGKSASQQANITLDTALDISIDYERQTPTVEKAKPATLEVDFALQDKKQQTSTIEEGNTANPELDLVLEDKKQTPTVEEANSASPELDIADYKQETPQLEEVKPATPKLDIDNSSSTSDNRTGPREKIDYEKPQWYWFSPDPSMLPVLPWMSK